MINLDQNQKKARKKKKYLWSANALYEGHELTLNAFKSGIFLIKTTKGKGLKILTPKQMIERLPIALAQVKAGNLSENLLNEIRQIIYSLYREKEVTKNCITILWIEWNYNTKKEYYIYEFW